MPGATRGFLGDVLVRAFHVITGFAEDKAADFVASKVVQAFDSQVDPGVYQLDRRLPESFKGRPQSRIASGASPSLVLIHGTFSRNHRHVRKALEGAPAARRSSCSRGFRTGSMRSTTRHSGQARSRTPSRWRKPRPKARGSICSRIRAADWSPKCWRGCAAEPVTSVDLFSNDGSSAQELKKLAELVARKRISVDRVVRVACPARGTLLASKRLDAYVSVVKWALELAQIPVAPELVNFLGEVARRRADPDMVPGLAAQIPDSPLVRWLHATDKPHQR